MGIQNLSSDVRGFLYSLFGEAAMSFKDATQTISPGLARAVTPPQGSLASAFQRVAFAARRGSLEEVNDAITEAVHKVNATTDPDLKDQLEGARLQQQLFYRGWVRENKQLQADLGSFSSGIF